MRLTVTTATTLLTALNCICVSTGCQSIRHGKQQIISIDSTPQSADVEIYPGGQRIVTPGAVVLRRRSHYTGTVRKSGFRSETFVIQSKSKGLWRNLVWIHPVAWIIGWVIDLTNGAAYELEAGSLSVTLSPVVTSELPQPEWQDTSPQ